MEKSSLFAYKLSRPLSITFVVASMARSLKLSDVVPKFTGDGEDVEMWLDRLHLAIEINSTGTAEEKTAELVRVLPLFLDKAAYATWKQLSVEDKTDLTKIQATLRRVYGLSKVVAWERLKALKWMPGDQIDVLADEARKLLNIVCSFKNLSDEIVALTVVDALPKVVADQVRMHYGEDMELDKVISCAKSLLISYGNTYMENRLIASAARIKDNSTTIGHRVVTRPNDGDIRCYGCRGIGHIRRECPLTCSRCHRKGHLQVDCRAGTIQENYAAGPASSSATPANRY